MTCPNCGNDNRDEATFCTQCGAPIPKRSGKLKRIFKWAGIGCGGLIGLFIVIIIIGAIASSGNDGNSVTAPVPTYIPLPTATFEEQKSVSTQIPYDDLFRNNEAHVGKKVWYEAKVVQVVEKGDDKYRLRADVTRGEYSWDDTVYLIYAGPRVLEDDIVQFVGIVEELYTYGAIFGNRVTIPAIRVINSRLVSETGRPILTPTPMEPLTAAPAYTASADPTPATPKPTLTPTPIPPGLTLDNPVAAGGVLKGANGTEIVVTGIVEDAWEVIKAEYGHSNPPQTGNRFYLITVEVTYPMGDDFFALSVSDFDLVGDTRLIYESGRNSCDYLPNRIKGELYPGGRKQGNICFEI